jgi:hypothetical protein
MSTTTTTTAPRNTTKQKVGLVLAGLYSLANIPSFLADGGGSGDDSPPMAILVVSSILGLVGLVATILAWRGNRVALRIAAGAVIVVTLTGLPAFFVDVDTAVKVLVGVSVLVTVVAVALMFSTDRRPAAVTD